MSESRSHPTATTACPRCDYNLDGAVAAFTDMCPLRGTCPECGMEFHWANLLRADRRQLPWLFEHCRAEWGAFLRALMLTTWRTLLPGWFWNRVKLWHDVRPGRLWLFVLLSAGGIVLPISLMLTFGVFVADWLGPTTPGAGRFMCIHFCCIHLGANTGGQRRGRCAVSE